MPSKSPDNGLGNLQEETNYCLKCWREFTTLSDKEREILKERKEYIRKLSNNKLFKYYEEE
jgi:hypothetical protein